MTSERIYKDSGSCPDFGGGGNADRWRKDGRERIEVEYKWKRNGKFSYAPRLSCKNLDGSRLLLVNGPMDAGNKTE